MKRVIVMILVGLAFSTGCWMTGSIHSAAKEGKADVVKRWLALGGDINEKDQRGATPLHCAIEGGNREVIKLLLEKGADLHQTNDIGNTPLHEAGWRGQMDVVQALVASGANPLAKAVDGKTPLDLARANQFDEIVVFLEAQVNREK